ncbi:uncharacterized protein K460DRAFT_430963 [Cucurbitaria berberidis CBS 394.84]|uniref:Uncharacterized protein n=1 Tax=Cucurbitaria berberidis CBS 394.84 TaxID=1168544 RepID=A0A9P4GIW4_9PLEO|nr:uncharacterized protein K460DRAFT_430963 [Cucurbitaria berberidis CBS 394.84]KAF1845996.1 hypothetical protein K460DRAFT_430963 [Cucurbitaria berberidis CBS 394.84]
MRSSTYIAAFAVSAVAQESATVLNYFQLSNTLTVLGSDASATTYGNTCPPQSPRLRRQDQTTSDVDGYSICEPFTLIQGASTYEFHLTDPAPGVWTIDMACKWQGAMTTADLTCAVTRGGYVAGSAGVGTTTTVLKQSVIRDMEAYQTVALVSASGASSGSSSVSASRTTSQSGTGAASPNRSGSGSGSAAATQSTGLAPAGPLATGAMGLLGGAGIFAAALAF